MTKSNTDSKLFGIAYTHDGGMPPSSRIFAWKEIDGVIQTWENRDDALEACENDGWSGYVCEYPSGNR